MSEMQLIDGLLDPFTLCLDSASSQRVVDFRIAPGVQEKLSEFAERANEGSLTEDEKVTYESLINAADFIAILKVKAQRLQSSAVHA
jgi:hypothetical protein